MERASERASESESELNLHTKNITALRIICMQRYGGLAGRWKEGEGAYKLVSISDKNTTGSTPGNDFQAMPAHFTLAYSAKICTAIKRHPSRLS